MSTLTTRDQTLQNVDVQAGVPKAAIRRTRPASMFSRLLTWYRSAVLQPETEQEKAEWQQNSF